MVIGALVPMTAAHAAEDVLTVTTIANGGAGSFKDALEQANASTNADGVRIVFDAALSGAGEIDLVGAPISDNMRTTRLGATGGNHAGTVGDFGARFVVDSAVPVSIDFTNLDGISSGLFEDVAGIYVASDSVSLSNLANVRVGASGIAISGTDVSVTNVTFSDPDSINMENGVALLDGATNVTLQDLTFESLWWTSILVDGTGDPAQQVTVTNITVDNVTSRGVESGVGHIDIEDTSIVNGLTITNSTFGVPAEVSTSHAMYFNPSNTVTDLVFSGNTVQQGTGAEKNVFYFENAVNSVFTNTVITDNTFQGISEAAPLSRIVGDNTATWNGLDFSDNQAEFTRGSRFSGEVNDAVISGNTFSYVREPSDAALTLGLVTNNVTVSDNFFDTPWAADGIRVEGTSATNVVIENNRIHDFYADFSWSAIHIAVRGTDSLVQNNELIQHLDRADGVDLPTTIANHWAIYNDANAVDNSSLVGWSILNNSIDGFGGNPNILTEAPIAHKGTGKLLVTGNTFGPNTRGSFDVETEEGPFWFLWNVWNAASNNTVQTFRAEGVRFNGTTGSFTATQPADVIGNNAATTPVTLHVYWTADNHAEEYLGAISGVTPGQTVSIPTTHTTGFLRVQTVDANGNSSQYSSIDQDVVVVPAAPAVIDVTETSATGTGAPTATVTVRDADGVVVSTGPVDAAGNWTTSGLACGTTYTVTQALGGEDSDPTEFTTADCPIPVEPTAPVVTGVTPTTVTGTGEPGTDVVVRDAAGNPVATSVVDADGNWSVDTSALACGTTYSVTLVRDDLASAPVEFTTPACATTTPPSPTTPSPTTPSPTTPAPTTAAPAVTGVTADAVTGTGTPGATVDVRNPAGTVSQSTTVNADGSWKVDATKLACNTVHTASQTVNGVQSAPVSFTTAACGPGGKTGNLANTGAGNLPGFVGGAMALLLLGAGAVVFARRRTA